MKNIIRKWLGIPDIERNVGQIRKAVYKEEGLYNGFAIPKDCLQEDKK
jgi:hypothetical protein